MLDLAHLKKKLDLEKDPQAQAKLLKQIALLDDAIVIYQEHRTGETTMKLNIISFDYTKHPGDTSDRQLLIVDRPSDSYLGLEIVDGDMTPLNDYFSYMTEVEQLKEKYKDLLKDMPYKRFIESKMDHVLEESVTFTL